MYLHFHHVHGRSKMSKKQWNTKEIWEQNYLLYKMTKMRWRPSCIQQTTCQSFIFIYHVYMVQLVKPYSSKPTGKHSHIWFNNNCNWNGSGTSRNHQMSSLHHSTNSSWLPQTSRNRLVNIDEPHMTRYDLIFSLTNASRLTIIDLHYQ